MLLDDVLGDVDDASAPRPGRASQQVEGVAGAEPVPLGEHPDGLLDPDPRGQRVLELGHRHGQPGRLVGGRGAGQGAGVPRRRFGRRGSGSGHEVRGQQVREHHRAGQIGGFLVADDPAPRGSSDYRLTRYRRAPHLPLPSLAPLVVPARAPRRLANCPGNSFVPPRLA